MFSFRSWIRGCKPMVGMIWSTGCPLEILCPDAPCMEYLPTFTLKIAQMWVNILYMEHLGMVMAPYLVNLRMDPFRSPKSTEPAKGGPVKQCPVWVHWKTIPATKVPVSYISLQWDNGVINRSRLLRLIWWLISEFGVTMVFSTVWINHDLWRVVPKSNGLQSGFPIELSQQLVGNRVWPISTYWYL